jgi:hypothetical protein
VQNDPANCLFLKFEELQVNPFRAVKQVSMFLELPMTSVELKSVVAQTVLQEMRNSVHAGGVYNDRSGTNQYCVLYLWFLRDTVPFCFLMFFIHR